MRIQSKLLTTGAAVVALAAGPAVALAANNGSHGGTHSQGATHSQGKQPGPKAGLPAKAKAYGRYCQTESKKHVAGMKGTPFSQCVTSMAKLATGTTTNPKAACKTESKKHVAGMKGTPFSACVKGAAQLRKTQSSSTTPGPAATMPAKAKAYGKYCQAESRKHVKGTPGTPFSQCVTSMAKLANGQTTSPKAACKTESKKHVKGMRGTPFSVCVKGAAQLKKTGTTT